MNKQVQVQIEMLLLLNLTLNKTCGHSFVSSFVYLVGCDVLEGLSVSGQTAARWQIQIGLLLICFGGVCFH